MGNQTSARLQGDDYQFLFAWIRVLELRMPKRQVKLVRIEDHDAKSLDDVTVLHEEESGYPDQYHQIKFHVNQGKSYSVEHLTQREKNSTSLIEKWYSSWKDLKNQRCGKPVEVHVVTVGQWTQSEPLPSFISSHDYSFTDDFFDKSKASQLGRLRETLRQHLGASDEEFRAFIKDWRLRLGFSSFVELENTAAERMENQGIKSGKSELKVAVGIVREWVKRKVRNITKEVLEQAIEEHGLWEPVEAQHAVHVHLVTIKTQKFEFEPEYVLDWRDYFQGPDHQRGHELRNPEDWNERLLPELIQLQQRINEEQDCRLIKVRGMARLSPWFAFGYSFSAVNRYTLEIAQGDALWRTDTDPSPEFSVHSNGPDGEALNTQGDTVALGISVTGSLTSDVKDHLTEWDSGKMVKAVLFVEPDRPLGAHCLSSAGDVVALVNQTKELVRHFVKRHSATRLLVYYFGPLSGACFLGHSFNAVCDSIVVMERSGLTYIPSFSLT